MAFSCSINMWKLINYRVKNVEYLGRYGMINGNLQSQGKLRHRYDTICFMDQIRCYHLLFDIRLRQSKNGKNPTIKNHE